MTNEPIELLPFAGIATPQGFIAGAARGGIKTHGDDVALVVSQQPAVAAAVFTRNQVKAAPVLVSARHAASGVARAIVVNAGNANCCTGEAGLANARRMCELAAQRLDCSPAEVLVCSTGIIGHPLPMDKVEAAIKAIRLANGQDSGQTVNEAVARAIMTTDTKPKFCAARAVIGGRTVTVGGVVKGVGMIGPDMGPVPHATLLSFLTTDAAIERPRLQRLLENAVDHSFNSVTIDGDTSTNDTCVLLANGASGVEIDDSNEAVMAALLQAVLVELAKKVAADGEGATKLVTIAVQGTASDDDARRIAMTIANSPLVKTAIFGRDPNWGRISAAAGRAGVDFDPRTLSVRLGDLDVFRNGEPAPFTPEQSAAVMEGDELTITVELQSGTASWTAWTCDFSYDYVRINAEYHT